MSLASVLEQKQAAKWQDELNRRKQARTALDFYYYNQDEYLKDDIKARYPNENQDILRYVFTAPLTEMMVKQLAVVFKESPTITIPEASKELEQSILALFDRVNLYKHLKQADRLTELTQKVGVIPIWDGAQTRLSILTPDKCFVETDPENPTQAIKIGYTIGQTDNPNMAEPVNIYRVWTKEVTYKAEINRDGKEIKAYEETTNRYGRIPIAWFEIDMPLDTFWLDAGNPFVELNRRINLQLTNLDIAMDYQSFSTMVTVGLDDEKVIPVGVTRRINIPKDPANMDGKNLGDVKYATPDAKLVEVWNIIRESIVWFAGAMGISAESISNGSSFTSGFQLKLSKQGVIDHNQDKRDMYLEAVRELCQLILDTERLFGTTNYPEQAQINIEFGEVAVDVDPMEQQQIIAAKLSNGTISQAGAILIDNPDMTQEEAQAKADEINAAKRPAMQTYTPISSALGINDTETD